LDFRENFIVDVSVEFEYMYINLYSLISGSKEKKTYKHINTLKKQQKSKRKKQRAM